MKINLHFDLGELVAVCENSSKSPLQKNSLFDNYLFCNMTNEDCNEYSCVYRSSEKIDVCVSLGKTHYFNQRYLCIKPKAEE